MREIDSKLFPDCEFYYCDQRSEEWFEARSGVLTASEMGAWLLKNDARSSATREKMICSKIAEWAGAWQPKKKVSDVMQRGIDKEPEAQRAFEDQQQVLLQSIGFCKSIHGSFGCSPDGLLAGKPIGYEGKVPLPETHIKYRRAGQLPDEYKWQVHGSMAVTGARGWWFHSWNPGLVPFSIFVERDGETEEFKHALIEFSEELEVSLQQEAAAWKETFTRKAA